MERNILRGRMETQLEHGQGLGLWFVYWTVVRSGGKLTVAVDEGTTIRVWLHSEDIPNDDLQWYLDLPIENDMI
jgi:signal transduction histidine kinase